MRNIIKKILLESKVNNIYYHGTNYNFDKFNLSNFGTSDNGYLGFGIYLTNDAEMASSYASDEGFILSCNVSSFNPYIINDFKYSLHPLKLKNFLGVPTIRGINSKITSMGYDSVMLTYVDDSGFDFIELCVFDTAQISIIRKETKEYFCEKNNC